MISLPATPSTYLKEVVVPALSLVTPTKLDTPSARVQLVTTAMQESSLRHRWQVIDPIKPETKGPARGLLQFERGGGVRGVMRSPVTKSNAMLICEQRHVPFDETAVWVRMETDDILCAAFGRQLLFADPHSLPPMGDEEGAWECYLRCWRPGAYERGADSERQKLRVKWASNYAAAMGAM